MTHLHAPTTDPGRGARRLPEVRLDWQTRSGHWWLWGAAGAVVVVAGAAMVVWGMFPGSVHGPGHFAEVMTPTCGLTRSVVATLRGDLTMAWRYNPLGPLVALGSVAVLVSVAPGLVTGRRPVLRVRPGRFGWLALVLAVVALELCQQGRSELLMSTGLR